MPGQIANDNSEWWLSVVVGAQQACKKFSVVISAFAQPFEKTIRVILAPHCAAQGRACLLGLKVIHIFLVGLG